MRIGRVDFTQDATANVTVRNKDDPTDAETVVVQVQYTPDPGDVNIDGTVGAVDVQLVINEALGVIDDALARMMRRELVSSGEVADLLLDVRMLLTTDVESSSA